MPVWRAHIYWAQVLCVTGHSGANTGSQVHRLHPSLWLKLKVSGLEGTAEPLFPSHPQAAGCVNTRLSFIEWFIGRDLPFPLGLYFIFYTFFFFLMWPIFKVFIEFVTIWFLVFWPWSRWGFSSPTMNGTCTPCIGRWHLNPRQPGTSLQCVFLDQWFSAESDCPSQGTFGQFGFHLWGERVAAGICGEKSSGWLLASLQCTEQPSLRSPSLDALVFCRYLPYPKLNAFL